MKTVNELVSAFSVYYLTCPLDEDWDDTFRHFCQKHNLEPKVAVELEEVLKNQVDGQLQ